MYYEYDKIHTKLVYDMAEYLDMEYTPGCTWVDLYCNGEYQGLYLLTEAITVGEGRVEIHDLDKESDANTNISGGYLIEREGTDRLDGSEISFTTDVCNYLFTLKSPELPSDAELDYIKNYVQNIENLIVAKDESYKDYIDLDSFAKQFLIDKLVLEPDAMRMSTFFYKDRNSEVLKSGPLWDYDRSFGTTQPDYTASMETSLEGNMNEWYMTLYEEEEYYNKLVSYYEQLLPFLEEMLNSRIDEYAAVLESAIAMDYTRYPLSLNQNHTMTYMEYESYIKYLKYFLASRVNYLNELWDVSYDTFSVPASTGEYHTVNLVMDDGSLLETRQVMDGDCIDSVPELDTVLYFGWQYYQTGKEFSSQIPVYENITLTAKRTQTPLEAYVEQKVNDLKAQSDLSAYLSLLADDELSICVYVNENSAIAQNEDIINAIKTLSTYEQPAQLDSSLASGEDYFLLIDNGWQSIWESTDGEVLSEIGTTFGPLNYGTADDRSRYLYILDTENNYLANADEADVVFVVVKRLSGSVEDIATFKDGQRIRY